MMYFLYCNELGIFIMIMSPITSYEEKTMRLSPGSSTSPRSDFSLLDIP